MRLRGEFQLLICLMRHAGQVLSREQLLDHVWGIGSDVTLNVVDATIKLLRKKWTGLTRQNVFKVSMVQAIGTDGWGEVMFKRTRTRLTREFSLTVGIILMISAVFLMDGAKIC